MVGWRVAKRPVQPLIDVIMRDGSFYHFTPHVLDVLLENDRVLKFKRSSGWVTVGVDPVRAKRRDDFHPVYYGPERRYSLHSHQSLRR